MEAVKCIVENMISYSQKVPAGSLFLVPSDKEGLSRDLMVKRVRHFLLTFIEDPNTDQALRAKCIELLLQMGLIYANAENLILAA